MQCNTVTFTATDGKQTSFPLTFLLERGAIIADKVNGEDIMVSMGGTNQLWIPGLPAKYFIRDIIDIHFSEEDEVPALPDFIDDGHDFTNRPNVSVKAPYIGYVGVPLAFEGWADDYDRAISSIQFSLDAGENWTSFNTEGSRAGRWTYWHFDYIPEKAGAYQIKIRAVNECGDASPIPAAHSFEVLEQQ